MYVTAAAVGVATHLYMVPVIAAHLGAVLARGEFDDRWRRRFLWVAALAGCAYAGMADVMLDATSAHARVFKADMPWRVATMATGGGWASVVLAPLVVVGAVVVLRGSRATGARPSAWPWCWWGCGPGCSRPPWRTGSSCGWCRASPTWWAWPWAGPGRGGGRRRVGRARRHPVIPGYTQEPTGYRAAAAVVRSVDAAGGRACIVGSTGLAPMLAYLDPPRLHPGHRPVRPRRVRRGGRGRLVADECPMVLPGPPVIDAAETRFAYRTVLPASDPALVLSHRPLTELTPA